MKSRRAGVHAIDAQLRVGLEGAAVEVRHGMLPEAQSRRGLAHRLDLFRRLAQCPAHRAQRAHLGLDGVFLLLRSSCEGGELLGERDGRQRRGGRVQQRALVKGVVVGRLQQRPDELPSRGVHAVGAQLRVGLEGAAVEVRHGVFAQM